MAFNKRTWKGRQGTGLNKFSINGATPVTVINQPDSVTEQGDALSAGNLNDLEDRIYTAFEDEATARANADSDLKDAISKDEARITNLEEKADPTGAYKTVNYRGTNAVPPGKAKYGLVESIVGKSRVWNQMLTNGIFANNTDGWSKYNCNYSVQDNVATLSFTGNSGCLYQQFDVIGGHKYLICGTIKSIDGANICIRTENAVTWNGDRFTDANWHTVYTILEPLSSGTLRVILGLFSGTGTGMYCAGILSRDLTLIFPEGVPSTIAECVQKCPDLLKPDAYGSSIVDTTVEGVKSVGVNIWDEEWEVATLWGNTCVASKNMINVKPSTTYYLYNSTIAIPDYGFILQEYDIDGNMISQTRPYTNMFTVSPQTTGIIFGMFVSYYGSTYNHDIQICLNSYTDKTTYHPYMTDTLTLSSSVTLRSAGTVADTMEPCVEVKVGDDWVYKRRDTQRIGTIVYDGSSDENWVLQSINDYGIANFTIAFPQDVVAEMNHSICNRFLPQTDPIYGATTEGFLQSASKNLYIRIQATKANSASAFKAWLANNPITMNYELADESVTLLDPIINNTILTEGGGTINTIQNNVYPDESPAPTIDNSMDVGYLAL